MLAHELRMGFTRARYPQNVDVRIRRKSGELGILSINFNSVLREEGVVLCTFRDVTAERAVEHELQADEGLPAARSSTPPSTRSSAPT